jgi:nitroreductase
MTHLEKMDTIDLLVTRRSMVAANITEPGPNAEEIDTILRCALRVPDHGKLGPWRIKVVQGKGQKRLGEIFAVAFSKSNPDADEAAVQTEYQRPCRAPVLLVISTKIESDKIPRWEQILSGGALCQNTLVAAAALGYRAQWLTEWPAYDEQIKEALGVDPTDEFLGFIYIGSSSEAPKERVRAELEDIVEYWND